MPAKLRRTKDENILSKTFKTLDSLQQLKKLKKLVKAKKK